MSSLFARAQAPTLNWEELTREYKFPEWYTSARFGIWVHWGAQSQPDSGGGWYARHMYMQNVGRETWGANAYPYHVRTYGHPSEKGFKDVIHTWKADKLDTDGLLRYFKSIGAKYFVALANHHDHFDNFASTYHPWNSVNVGPGKDLIGLFRKSAAKYGIPFGVSSHDDRYLSWWLPAFGADSAGPKKGVPYDGRMTKADGKNTWWAGLDPADLYGLPPEKRTAEWIAGVKKNWVQRHVELVTKYDVDMLWFDGYGFPYGEFGKEACTAFFNDKLKRHGKINAVISGKFHGKEPAIAEDVERGGAEEIQPHPWQGTLTFDSWFYKSDRPIRHNARTVIESLIDMNSKNGNLLLNVELLPDGRIPQAHKLILDTVGSWINRNADAIYGSKPWKIYGDNLGGTAIVKNMSEADLDAAKKQTKSHDFNERTIAAPLFPHNEVRFTAKGKSLYVFVLNPAAGELMIPSLGSGGKYGAGNITSVQLLGSKRQVRFRQASAGLTLDVQPVQAAILPQVYKITGAIR
ncbi:alpha-L-fucosidase [Chitinophaga rhizosphaerae]|uniref:alpha-L-fucosidase n=1 Tax=Chitinophaga rhizosphaerae TaxID=1864947 RepID=UPI0013DEA219|nr:alpha-L-fucosidase [Chitinophaga rhizosphaerae]